MTDDFSSLFAFNRRADDRPIAVVRGLTHEQYKRTPEDAVPTREDAAAFSRSRRA